MCLIVKKPAGMEIPTEHLVNSATHNPDGWGVMWASKGKVHTRKGMGHIREAMPVIDSLTAKTCYVHQRYATHGATDLANGHPFCILDKTMHGTELYMMHNGVLNGVPDIMRDRSDTYHYAMMLRGILAGQPELLADKKFLRDLSGDIRGSKFVFLFGDGREIIINEDEGKTLEGLWYSNTYSLAQPRKYTPLTPIKAYASAGMNDDDDYGDWWEERQKENASDGIAGELRNAIKRAEVSPADMLGELTDDDIATLCQDDPWTAAEILVEARNQIFA